jgi:hypothetical protein
MDEQDEALHIFEIYGFGRKWTLVIDGRIYCGAGFFKTKRSAQFARASYKLRHNIR